MASVGSSVLDRDVAGCANAVVFSTSQLAGIELNAAENNQQTVKVGLSRVEAISMPWLQRTDPLVQ